MVLCLHGVVLINAHYDAHDSLLIKYRNVSGMMRIRLHDLCPCMAANPPAVLQRCCDEDLIFHQDEEFERQRFQARSKPKKKTPDQRDGTRWYFITLTQPPTANKTFEQLIKNTNNILSSRMVAPIEWVYSLEYQTNGSPHIHLRLQTSLYLDYGKIAKFNNNGVRGSDRQYWRAEIEPEKWTSANYVVKEETKPTLRQLKDEGLDTWFFCSENYSGPRPENIFSSPDIQDGSPLSS